MPTPPRPPSGVTRVAFSGTFNGTNWANVMHVKVNPSGVLTQTIANELAIQLHNAYFYAWGPHLSLQWNLLATDIVMFGDPGNVFEAGQTSPGSGQDSGLTLPANVALCVSWKTSAYYRGGHSRTYLCGIVQDRLENSKSWSAQTLADFAAGALDFRQKIGQISVIGVSSVTFGYLQQFANGGSLKTPREYLNPPVFHPIVGHTVHPRVDSQRRRLGRELSS